MENLWKIRMRKQMSVAQLSSRAGVPARRIYEYESGKRAIPMRDLEKLAKALFVDVMEIKALSDPIPQELAATPLQSPEPALRMAQAPAARTSARIQEQEAISRRRPSASAPVRENQISHMLLLAQHFSWDQDALEREIGKPLKDLTRAEASRWLKTLQERLMVESPKKIKRRRPYLPESVDTFEFRYLEDKREKGSTLTFTLFNGERLQGRIVGFSPYHITIRGDKEEVTLNKLAIAYYRAEVEETT